MNNASKKLLYDVLIACQELEDFLAEKTRDDYADEVLLRRGVERDLEIIGEALSQLRSLDTETFERIPDGARIVAMRHRLIHGYAQVSNNIVWDTAQHDIPVLRDVVEELLNNEPPGAVAPSGSM